MQKHLIEENKKKADMNNVISAFNQRTILAI